MSDCWHTPPAFFDVINSEFAFQLDAAASDSNALCGDYFTEKQDALVQEWNARKVYLNPPYSLIGPFVKKAYEECQAQHNTVVVLIPTYSDPKYWRDYVCKAHEVRNLVGRLQFLENGKKKQSARFPSSLVVFKWIAGEHFGKSPNIWSWNWKT